MITSMDVEKIQEIAESFVSAIEEAKNNFSFIYSILYNPCIFKAYRLLNVQT